jgi:hypothetical protein
MSTRKNKKLNLANDLSKYKPKEVLATIKYLHQEGFISFYESPEGELFVKVNEEDITKAKA